MKILLVANGFPPTAFGGVETYSDDLARALHQKGHVIIVFCRESDFSLPDHEVLDRYESGFRVVRVVNDYKRITSFRETFLDERIDNIFQDLLKETEPDIVHFQHLIALSANLPGIASQRKLPFVSTLHDFWPLCHRVNLTDWQQSICGGPVRGGDCFTCVDGGPSQPQISPGYSPFIRVFKRFIPPQFRRRARRILFPEKSEENQPPALVKSREVFAERYEVFKHSISLSRRLLAPSDYLRSQYLSNGYSNEIQVLPLGIESSGPIEPAAQSGEIIFGSIGSVIPIKGLHILIKAFTQIPSDNIRLHIYGREDVYPLYAEQIRSLAANDPRIHFKGSFSPAERSSIYKEIDVLVISSIVPETFSLVAREGLLHHKPVIASQIGALKEIIFEGLNGFLFPPADDQELSKIIFRIAQDPAILQDLDLPGPEPIDSIQEHAEKIENLYIQTANS